MLDYLVDHLDGFKHLHRNTGNDVSGVAADTLFKIWKDKKNTIAHRLLNRPSTISLEDVNVMKKEGLVRDLGDKLEVTDKGSKVIRIMILGDDRSTFDKNVPQITYAKAKANTQERSMKVSKQNHENNWWEQVLKQ